MLENDLIEAIVAMPTDLFYNTGIATYVWLLSKNKSKKRKGKIQLIDATQIFHKLRKPLGNKKNEFAPEDRAEITRIYADFKESEVSKIYDNTEFIYKEYTVMQPLQRSYGFTEERIQNMLQSGALKSLWDDAKVAELEEKGTSANAKEKKALEEFYESKSLYDEIVKKLNSLISDEKWLSPEDFIPVLDKKLKRFELDGKLLDKIADGLSLMDKDAEIQKVKSGKNAGEIIWDKATKDTELVRFDETIEEYMEREVLPHVPDAQWFWEENIGAKKPVIKTGAEIPFTRYFYKYQQPESSEKLAKKFAELEKSVDKRISKLFGKA